MDFNIGDVVIVRSGGVPMTVSKVVGDEVHCQWLDAKQKAQRGSFAASVLKPFTRSGPMRIKF